MTFEWSLDYRLIHTDGTSHFKDLDAWMGDSRGHWEGDTLVVDVRNNNDKTWFDMAGDFHSDVLRVIERYRMTGRDTIEYEATMEDSKVFTKPWTIRLAFHRRTDRDRLFEYVCQAEVEEENGVHARGANLVSGQRNTFNIPASFTGFLNQTEISQAYVAADCLVLPSDYGETWGLVVNEALASQLPCIVSDACGCAENLVPPDQRFRMGNVEALANKIEDVARGVSSVVSPPDVSETVQTVVRAYRGLPPKPAVS
jgi:glycosyltransferase involved in cell wall biosynthesis